MPSPSQCDSLYSEQFAKDDLYRFMRSQSGAKGVIVPLNLEGTQACLMLDSPHRRESLVETGRSNQILVRAAFHWRALCTLFNIEYQEAVEVPPTWLPAHVYTVARIYLGKKGQPKLQDGAT